VSRSGRALPVALVAFVALGLPDGMLGVAWPSIRATFDQPLAALGQILLAGTAGYLAGSGASGFVSDRLGTGAVLLVSTLLLAAAMLLYAVAPAWPLILAAALGIGLGGGGVDAGANAHVALEHGPGAMNMLHACYGLGATMGPLAITGVLAAGLSWRVAYAGMLAVDLALVAAYALTIDRWGGVRPAATRLGRGTPARLPWALIAISMALFFVYTAIEVSAGQWSYTFLTMARATPAAAAGVAVSAYWAGLTAGRLGAAALRGRVAPTPLLHGSVVVILVALTVFWWSPAPAVGLAGLVLTGAGFAAVFPSLLSLTPARVGDRAAARVVGLQLGTAGAGSSLGPAAVGVVLQRGGAALLAPLLLAGAAFLAVLHIVATLVTGAGHRDRGG
jgi:fucose permease